MAVETIQKTIKQISVQNRLNWALLDTSQEAAMHLNTILYLPNSNSYLLESKSLFYCLIISVT